jgi:hypothetical protein
MFWIQTIQFFRSIGEKDRWNVGEIQWSVGKVRWSVWKVHLTVEKVHLIVENTLKWILKNFFIAFKMIDEIVLHINVFSTIKWTFLTVKWTFPTLHRTFPTLLWIFSTLLRSFPSIGHKKLKRFIHKNKNVLHNVTIRKVANNNRISDWVISQSSIFTFL